MSNPDHFRVVIVGGGVAGLTLANALEQYGIDYVLLERRGEVAPQVGASIGLLVSAARIFDQLGVWDKIVKEMEILSVFYNRNSKGQPISPPDFSPHLFRARTGYSGCWGERQILLRVLHENLKDRSKILVNKDIIDIRHDADGVSAVCGDGSSFRGDILVGADGVYSKTRTKIWELAEPANPALIKAEKDSMICEYNCLFGIAKGVPCPQIAPGDVHVSFNQGRCCLMVVSEGGKVYWFAQERLPETYRLGNIPRYTDDDARAFVARHGDITMIPAPNGLTVADLWQKTVSFRLVAIEEANFKLWHWGRIACVGDSAHKATPNLGVGGNSAIESAAAIANGIKRLVDTCNTAGRRPTQQEVERMLDEYQKKREVRAEAVVNSSGQLARAHNMHGLVGQIFVKFIVPNLAEFLTEMFSAVSIGAVKLDFLPLPMLSLTGTRPFNPSQGYGLQESKLKRMLLALPLLFLSFAAVYVMNITPVMDETMALRDAGKVDLGTGTTIPILRSLYGLRDFDDFVALVNTFFFPTVYGTDPVSRRQIISFLTDGTVLLTIWMFESVRRANMITPMVLPNLFTALGQLFGIGVMAPLYCFLHYVFSPVEKFSSLDQRLTCVRWSRAALPAVLLAYTLPFYATMAWPDLPFRQVLLFVWQLYPLWLSLAAWVISRGFRDTTAKDKLYNVKQDLPVMRVYVLAASALAAGMWWWAGFASGFGLREVFVPVALPRNMSSFADFTREFLKWDATFGFSAHLVWMGYLFWDLSAAGMLREGWLTAVGLGLVSVVTLGPGVTLGLGWLWREHILATRRHKDALTPESVARLHAPGVRP
ncbi:hypothetical protein C8A03DRAFT_14582 [Achaetomium macrosporum]|uniref:FAD-binding domain-containing protein n=1 Tax=Achaetomium macrosporum TaxID=79813 RepID=A0AAN7HG25_9PEZI|nr:hypothetical protein C8A03DRAFT_14582 [Achaetomium macrosporum]